MVGYNRRFQAAAGEFRRIVTAIQGRKIFTSRFLRERRAESIFYEDILGHSLDFICSVAGPLRIESVRTFPPETPGAIFSGIKIEAVSDAGDCTFEIRPTCGRNIESYECQGLQETAVLCYHPLEKLAAPPELTRYTPGLRECILAPSILELQNLDALRYIQGFVHQMASFVRLVNGLDAGPYCSLHDAKSTAELIHRVLDVKV